MIRGERPEAEDTGGGPAILQDSPEECAGSVPRERREERSA